MLFGRSMKFKNECSLYHLKRYFAVKVHAERAQLSAIKQPKISDEMMKKHLKESRYLLARCTDITQVWLVIFLQNTC